jgi:succinoglycan biosynthesis transport protein ExoP
VTTGELLRASAGGPAIAGAERRSEPRVDLAARTRAALAGRSDDAPASSAGAESHVGSAARRRRRRGTTAAGQCCARPRCGGVSAMDGTPTTAPALALARALAGSAKVVLVGLVPDAAARETLGLESNATGLADVVRGAASFGQVIRRDKGSRDHLVAFGAPMPASMRSSTPGVSSP